ncbi:multidrug resistance-associated protein 5-like isoform X2 [Zootermopsis nevadensis]|uniref:multidrug resistance-associated protein 5-like isoform X2 n=1 Tax=Zootermopsis nevadensis TaxID=136037 RepID=UPI000B8ECCBF|nr:multidrug resistance-associated protein 5-like isoform X2 [Zootermopsis nevadensis]
MNNGDNSKGSKSQEGSDVKAYPLSEDEHIRETPGPSYSIPTAEGSIRHGPYRAYVRTSPQYIPGHGVRKYKTALKNLIPVRKKAKQRDVISVDSAGLISFISFSWMSQYMYKASKKGLTAEDIPEGSPLDSCDLNGQRLELLWQEEVSCKGPRRASFGSVVWRFMRTRIIMSSFVFSCSVAMGFISPTVFMRKLLQYAEDENGDMMEGVTWAVCLTLSEFLRTIFFSWSWALNYRTAIRLRSACLAILYRKVIRLNSLGGKSVGELINLFSNDGQRIFDMVLFGPMIIGGPIVTVCGMLYILWLLGPWALLGMATFLLFYPTQYGISRMMGYLRSKTVIVSDQRVRLMTEILSYIRFIKIYAWEKCFIRDLLRIRSKECNFLQKTAYCHSLSISMAPTVPVISAIITFLAHISAGNNLTAAQAFSLVPFLSNQMKDALSRIRQSTRSVCDALVSLSRIKSILLLEDISPYITRPIDKTQAVCISRGTLSWDSVTLHKSSTDAEKNNLSPLGVLQKQNHATDQEKEKLNPCENTECPNVNALRDINFQVAKGHLIGVCGHVGSGKTALLLAALGQLRLVSGQVTRDGSCAYVSQEPWILNATLRDNILFGENFDSKRYYEAIYSCSLTQDINMLPGGDQTEIGERGINLSGGQKQRLALARALYANRDIYLLDDPLSAVDAYVGTHIFNTCILHALKHKTVILVTHQEQYLNQCNMVYMMKDGCIFAHGTHDELMAKEQDYAMLVKTHYSKRGEQEQCVIGEESPVCAAEVLNSDYLAPNSQNRPVSSSSQVSVEDTEKLDSKEGEQLTTPEFVQKGNIRFHTYQNYISAAGGYFIILLMCLSCLLNVGSTAFSSWWLALWIKAGGGNATVFVNNQTEPSHNISDNPDFPMYQMVYAVMIAVILGTSLLRGLAFTKVTLRASSYLHNQLFMKLMHSPLHFFETTPAGRIQNLFSRDMDEVDVRLPTTIESFLQNVWIVLFAILFVCLVFPWFIIPLVILAVIYYFISKIFRVAIRDLKRLENVSRSPIFSWVGTTVQGLSTVHAFGKESDFLMRFTKMFDENTTCLYLCSIAMRWLAVRIDTLAVTTICITAFLTIFLHGQVPPALAGLALSYAAHISGVFQYTLRLVSEIEIRFISVERISLYIKSLECEGKQGITLKPPSDWPSKGNIKFQNVTLQYRKGLPDALNNVSFSVQSGETLGIVGRTGSGKSSLIAALLRLVEVSSGKIKIDGLDIADINLEQLRTQLSVIPQDPVLFDSTIRFNLDPFESCTDDVIWEVLEKTKLRDRISNIGGQLQACVGQGRESLSVGERQLLCLARALLRNAKILVLDEATASIDPETEAAVQSTVQNEFKHCTVLTIAHRLSTVTSCDKILVMDKGQVFEFGTPANLMSNPNSKFSKMLSVADAVTEGQSYT